MSASSPGSRKTYPRRRQPQKRLQSILGKDQPFPPWLEKNLLNYGCDVLHPQPSAAEQQGDSPGSVSVLELSCDLKIDSPIAAAPKISFARSVSGPLPMTGSGPSLARSVSGPLPVSEPLPVNYSGPTLARSTSAFSDLSVANWGQTIFPMLEDMDVGKDILTSWKSGLQSELEQTGQAGQVGIMHERHTTSPITRRKKYHKNPLSSRMQELIRRRWQAASYTTTAGADQGQDWFGLFQRADKDHKGFVDEEEFISLFRRQLRIKQGEISAAQLRRLFRFLDVAESKTLSTDELFAFLSGEGPELGVESAIPLDIGDFEDDLSVGEGETEEDDDDNDAVPDDPADGLPINCPPPLTTRRSGKKATRRVSITHADGAMANDYVNGPRQRAKFFDMIREMGTRPNEAEKVSEWLAEDLSEMEKRNKQGKEWSSDDTVECAATRILCDHLIRGPAQRGDEPSPPRPIILHHVLQELRLKSMSLGDKFGRALADTLPWLPQVNELNLSDNRLTDESLPQLVKAFGQMKNLRTLDLSWNDVDGDSADAIREFLGNPLCKLQKLSLAHADVDDDECAALVAQLQFNRHLTDLDLSENLIGRDEPRRIGNDKTSGCYAIAGMLESTGSLKSLNLSWNYIGTLNNNCDSSSAVVLAKSLKTNDSLTYLNLSNNSVNNLPAQQIGEALNHNNSLNVLDLGYNSMTAKDFTVLASCFASNFSLRKLIFDGNLPGVLGSQAVFGGLRMCPSERTPLSVSLQNCNTEITDASIFDPQNPAENYILDLASPYDRMVSSELIRLATTRSGFAFRKVEHIVGKDISLIELERRDEKKKDPGRQALFNDLVKPFLKKNRMNLEDVQQSFNVLGLTPNEETVTKATMHLAADFFEKAAKEDCTAENLLTAHFDAIFSIVDVDGSDALDRKEIKRCCDLIGISMTSMEMEQLLDKYDTDGSGELERVEFSVYMASRLTSLPLETKGKLYDTRSGKVWKPPEEGKLKIDFQTSPCAPSIDSCPPDVSLDGMINILKSSKVDSEKERLFNIATGAPDLLFTRHQAQEVINECKTIIDKLYMVERLVFVMVSTEDAVILVENNLTTVQKVVLRIRLQQSWPALMGMPGGCYQIDLDERGNKEGKRPLPPAAGDKQVLRRITGLAQLERDESPIDTSQWGNGYQVRNILTTAKKETQTEGTPGVSDWKYEPVNGKTLDFHWFANLATKPDENVHAIIFDYIPTTRPRVDMLPVSDNRFHHFLEQLGLLDASERDHEGDEEKKEAEVTSRLMRTVLDSPAPSNDIDMHLEAEETNRRHMVLQNSTYKRYQEAMGRLRPTADIAWGMCRTGEDQEMPAHWKAVKRLKSSKPAHYRTLLLKLYQIQAMATRMYFTVEQVLQLWRMFEIPKLVNHRGRNQTTKTDGGEHGKVITNDLDSLQIRIELLMSLFNHIVDIENFPVILRSVTFDDRMEIQHRFGMLNIMNPVYPEGFHWLELDRYEDREWAKVLIVLAVAEDGENWQNERYSKLPQWFDELGNLKDDLDWWPGWDLKETWTVPDTPRQQSGCAYKGILKLCYCDAGCIPDMYVRKDLKKKFHCARGFVNIGLKRVASDGTELAR